MYVPSADRAYDSLLYMNIHQPLGWFLRSLHYYAGSGMVVMVLAHMTQVFLHGAYKYPRELTWLTGVVLLLCTLGMFFTGQVLRWDPDAYWGLAVGGAMAGRVPGIGPWLVHLVLGGPIIGGAALSRFFALHVFIIPGVAAVAVGGPSVVDSERGVSAPPEPGQMVVPRPTSGVRKGIAQRRSFSGRRDAQRRSRLGVGRDHGRRDRSHCRTKGADGTARSNDGRSQSTAGMAFSLAFRFAFAQPAGDRNIHHARVSAGADCSAGCGSLHFESRRASAEPSAGRRC